MRVCLTVTSNLIDICLNGVLQDQEAFHISELCVIFFKLQRDLSCSV